MDIGDTVKWTGAHEGTWAWPGKGKIVSYDPNRRWFEGNRVPPGQPCHGPAVQLSLEHNNLDVWVSPDELTPWVEPKAAVFR